MYVKQTIAIIGAASAIGKAMAIALAKKENRLLLFAKEEQNVQAIADEIKNNTESEVESIPCSVDASWEADIIILAIPQQEQTEIARKIENVVRQKIVISISHPSVEKPDEAFASPGVHATEDLQKLLPDSKVISLVNTMYAADFLRQDKNPQQAEFFIAGDHTSALNEVEELVRSAGLYPVIAENCL